MFTDPERRKKFGIIMLVIGIVCALLMFALRESNQPVYVSSSFGSGYMTDGWGDALPMINFLIGLSVAEAVVGLLLILTARSKE